MGHDYNGCGSQFERWVYARQNAAYRWSVEETQDLLMVRVDLDPAFMDTKRNKLLWEMVSTRMSEMGYTRGPDQCKCKWKNLVARYKGCETMDTERMRQQFPYYKEMETMFTARMESENNSAMKKKRKMKISSSSLFNAGGFREMMEGYMKQQMEMEMQWMKAYEERETRRRVRETEWRQRMEGLEKERMSMEIKWRDKERERRIREDKRAEKREALVVALLNKLRRDDI